MLETERLTVKTVEDTVVKRVKMLVTFVFFISLFFFQKLSILKVVNTEHCLVTTIKSDEHTFIGERRLDVIITLAFTFYNPILKLKPK